MPRQSFLLLLSLFAAVCLSSRAFSSEGSATVPSSRIEYSLEWWIGEDGTSTKFYEVLYSGDAALSRLKSFGDPVRHLENSLPYREENDTLITSGKSADGRYFWKYQGQPQPAFAQKKNLSLWLPVFNDPAGLQWSSHDHQRYSYDFQSSTVVNRLTLRAPWPFESSITASEQEFTAGPITALLTLRAVPARGECERKDPGCYLPGVELAGVFRSDSAAELPQSEVRKIWENYWKWTPVRLQGNRLVAGERGATPNYGVFPRNRLSGLISSGYLGFMTPYQSFGTGAIGLGVSYDRWFTGNLGWKILSTRINLGYGNTDAGGALAFEGIISSLFDGRVLIPAKSAVGFPYFWSIDFLAGPEFHGTVIADFGRNNTSAGPSAALMAGARFGVTVFGPGYLGGLFSSFGIGGYYSRNLPNLPTVSSWNVAVEIY
ncbi:MAG: hypothetical protein ACXWPM_08915 [Bdellovibrionota bacterium]